MALPAVAVLILLGCRPEAELSQFALDKPVTGRVVANVTACVVDAMCLLRIEFADTVVEAIYGTGERPAPLCTIPIQASDAAFAVEQGEVILARIAECPAEGYFLQALLSGGGEPRR